MYFQAFLLVNMVLGTIFFIGNGISGFTLSYLLCMGISVAHLFSPYVLRTYKKIQQHAGEFIFGLYLHMVLLKLDS